MLQQLHVKSKHLHGYIFQSESPQQLLVLARIVRREKASKRGDLQTNWSEGNYRIVRTGSNSTRGFKVEAHHFNKPSVRFGSRADTDCQVESELLQFDIEHSTLSNERR